MLEPKQKIIAADGKSYIVGEKLGRGKTAVVFAGIQEETREKVAVKVQVEGLPEELSKRFYSERENLANLAMTEAAQYVPRMYASNARGDTDSYLIIGFVSAVPVSDILEKDGRLSEEDALEIGKQFMVVLRSLHELGHTYTDIKLENIRWDSQNRKVTVTDWNVIGSYGNTEGDRARFEIEKKRDLLHVAGYIYQLLTGEPVPSSTGLSKSQLESSSNFKSLSLNSQWLLEKALHPNEKARFDSAGSLYDALDEAVSLWQLSEGQLLGRSNDYMKEGNQLGRLRLLELLKVRRELKKAPSDPTIDQMYQAAVDAYREHLYNQETHGPVIGGFYKAGDYDRARARIAQALQDDRYDLAAWRWAQAIELAQSLDMMQGLERGLVARVKQALPQAVDNLNNGLWEAANNILITDVSPNVPRQPAMQILLKDSEALMYYQRSQEKLKTDDVEGAQADLSKALLALMTIVEQDYRESLQYITGDLKQHLDIVRARHEDRRLQQELREFDNQFNKPDQMLEVARRGLASSSAREATVLWCQRNAETLLGMYAHNVGKVRLAWKLLVLASSTRDSHPRIREWELWARKFVSVLREREGGKPSIDVYNELSDFMQLRPASMAEPSEQKFWDGVSQLRRDLLLDVIRKDSERVARSVGAVYRRLKAGELQGQVEEHSSELATAEGNLTIIKQFRSNSGLDDREIDKEMQRLEAEINQLRGAHLEAVERQAKFRQDAEKRQKEAEEESRHREHTRRMAEMQEKHKLALAIWDKFAETVQSNLIHYKRMLKSAQGVRDSKDLSEWERVHSELHKLTPFYQHDELARMMKTIQDMITVADEYLQVDVPSTMSTSTQRGRLGAQQVSNPPQDVEEVGELLSNLRSLYEQMHDRVEKGSERWDTARKAIGLTRIMSSSAIDVLENGIAALAELREMGFDRYESHKLDSWSATLKGRLDRAREAEAQHRVIDDLSSKLGYPTTRKTTPLDGVASSTDGLNNYSRAPRPGEEGVQR